MTGTGRLTRAQAHRLIETYGYSGPREPAVDRLTTAELFIFDALRRDRLELDTDASRPRAGDDDGRKHGHDPGPVSIRAPALGVKRDDGAMKKILVGAAAFGCRRGPSGADKTEIPG